MNPSRRLVLRALFAAPVAQLAACGGGSGQIDTAPPSAPATIASVSNALAAQEKTAMNANGTIDYPFDHPQTASGLNAFMVANPGSRINVGRDATIFAIDAAIVPPDGTELIFHKSAILRVQSGANLIPAVAGPVSPAVFWMGNLTKVSGGLIDMTAYHANAYAVLAYNKKAVVVAGVRIKDAAGIAIGLSLSSGCIVSGCSIDGTRNWQPGIWVHHDDGTASNNVIMDNDIRNAALDGIIVAADGCTISNNNIVMCGMKQPPGGALGACGVFAARPLQTLTLRGNRVVAVGESGFDLTFAIPNGAIVNVSENFASSCKLDGFRIEGAGTINEFYGNWCEQCGMVPQAAPFNQRNNGFHFIGLVSLRQEGAYQNEVSGLIGGFGVRCRDLGLAQYPQAYKPVQYGFQGQYQITGI